MNKKKLLEKYIAELEKIEFRLKELETEIEEFRAYIIEKIIEAYKTLGGE